ncbi:hypothetical protein BK004_00315 [bacterium CG10_46_32]|nr:MAG: hypothetical protein BK004_00315 [bacterium CG10_46_32]
MKQSEIEKKILDFWQEDGTFRKSVDRKAPKGEYTFYDGPPFATGTPHYGHIVASLIKDMVPRYFTMQGFRVERRWGWDCHGLPIENIVEKEHGFKHKKDIIAYGVSKFNEDARSKVLKYVDEWKNVITHLGRWVDFDNDYKTMDPEFMESVWWALKELHDKGLLYEAYRSMHICPRCETTLAQSEVAQGYQDVTDLSVIAKFELVDEPGTYLLAWTTTPWTLPGNVALAVGKDLDYVKVTLTRHPERSGAESKDLADEAVYVLAKDRLADVFKDAGYEVIGELSGKDLIGLSYKPLFPYYDNDKLEHRENAFKVYAGDFVNTEEGTGIVHIAPAFGEDDYALSKKEHLPFVQHVHMDGTFKNEVKDFAGRFVKHQDNPNATPHDELNPEPTDVSIIKYLKAKGLWFTQQKIKHSYPHCWRCDSPLLNYATSSWFVAVEKIKPKLLKNAEKINWMPEHIKEGRFGQWLAGARDWSISRQRFWGSVLPIWKCEKDEKHIKVIGSVKELEDVSGKKVTDLHKHFVDTITFPCKECKGNMKRIPDVLDCWFEAGSMPYGQQHYPFENKDNFKDTFPALFIAEGVDQTRAWFYYLHVLAGALFGKGAFKNVVVNGTVLAEDGKKMSKRLQNYPDPMDMFKKYGADAVRYYLATSPVLRAEDFNFTEKGVDEVVKKVLLIIYNVLSFYQMYAKDATISKPGEKHVLDRWIVAKTNQLIAEVTEAYEGYDLNKATRPIAEYINELSTWYLRRSRDRIKNGDSEALETLKWCLEQCSLVAAPVMPFTTEHVWKELGHSESVHLSAWPSSKKTDEAVLTTMHTVRQIVELGLSARAEAGIKIRQPLSSARVSGPKLSDDFSELICDELNVKNVTFIQNSEHGVSLDTEITSELKTEGNVRELVRTINGMRKKKGLTPGDKITLTYHTTSSELKKVFDEYADELKKAVIAQELLEKKNNGETFDINGEKITITL